MSRHDLATIVSACAAIAGLAWFAYTRNGRRLAYVTALAVHRLLVRAEGEHALNQPAGVRDVLRELATAAQSWPRWKLWMLLTRSRRVCPANAHGALIWRTRPVREILVDDGCRQDCALNGRCWCGNLRDDDKLRAPAADGAPGDGPAPAPSGAGPRTDAAAAVSPYPPPTEPQPALRELLEPLPAARPYVPEMLP